MVEKIAKVVMKSSNLALLSDTKSDSDSFVNSVKVHKKNKDKKMLASGELPASLHHYLERWPADTTVLKGGRQQHSMINALSPTTGRATAKPDVSAYHQHYPYKSASDKVPVVGNDAVKHRKMAHGDSQASAAAAIKPSINTAMPNTAIPTIATKDRVTSGSDTAKTHNNAADLQQASSAVSGKPPVNMLTADSNTAKTHNNVVDLQQASSVLSSKPSVNMRNADGNRSKTHLSVANSEQVERAFSFQPAADNTLPEKISAKQKLAKQEKQPHSLETSHLDNINQANLYQNKAHETQAHQTQHDAGRSLSSAARQQVNNNILQSHSEANKPVSLDYSFQRWSGDHSVKITLPADKLHDQNRILQPSDVRAADALNKQIEYWPKYSSATIDLQQGDKQQQSRQQQQQQQEQQEEQT